MQTIYRLTIRWPEPATPTRMYFANESHAYRSYHEMVSMLTQSTRPAFVVERVEVVG